LQQLAADLEQRVQDRTAELERARDTAERANRAKSEFLSRMSHELRTPLNAILGFGQLLEMQLQQPGPRSQVRQILDAGQHLLTLINDVLDLAKIESGRMELDPAEVDVPQLLESAMNLVRERAERQGLRLSLALDPAVQRWVLDERKVKQVLINLLSNAVKFTPAGGEVTVQARRPDSSRLELAVIDTGCGIAPQEQEQVFEEFRQASGHYLRKSEGTGLGLALARRFVELHGGRLGLHSSPGQGSTFTFTLPAGTMEPS
jgi:signal transduction histidine kinase